MEQNTYGSREKQYTSRKFEIHYVPLLDVVNRLCPLLDFLQTFQERSAFSETAVVVFSFDGAIVARPKM